MSEPTPAPRHVLHLVVEGFPDEKLEELKQPSSETTDVSEIFPLTETSAGEALQKIFSSDTVAVWGKI